MKSAYPSNYLLLMPKNKTSFTFVVGAEQKKSQREKKKPMASSGPQEANGHPGAGKRMWVVGGRWWYVSHRWRRSAYVTCLVFVPCSKFLQKASADNCSIQECFVLVACCLFPVSVGFGSCSAAAAAASCGSCLLCCSAARPRA